MFQQKVYHVYCKEEGIITASRGKEIIVYTKACMYHFKNESFITREHNYINYFCILVLFIADLVFYL